MRDPLIVVDDVSKYYKLYTDKKDRFKEALHPFGKIYHHPFYALRHINCTIHKGEIVGILGKNGSGKSTLLKIISRVLAPNHGSVTVNGHISALLELGAGFNPEFSGIENIYFYGTILGLDRRQIDENLEEIIRFTDIGEYIHQPLKSYSSGMRARLAFAVAVHIKPDILILDEVLSVGDTLFQRKSFAKMQELFEQGSTVIYVSHNLPSIVELCTRAILLHDHTIVMDGNPKDVVKQYQKLLYSEERSESTSSDTAIEAQQEIPLFLPDLVTENLTVQGENSAIIDGIKIIDHTESCVNVLQTHHIYTLQYRVHFRRKAAKVVFGAQIVSLKGVRISGASMSNIKEYLAVNDQDTYLVSWSFTCKLLNGTYFFNIGVADFTQETPVFMCRIADAYAFKVENDEPTLSAGFVTLDQRITYHALPTDT